MFRTLLRAAGFIGAICIGLCANAAEPSKAAAAPLTLDELIERARSNDLRVKEAEAELRNFRAKSAQADWAWFPKFETTLGLAGPTPEAVNDGFGGPPLTEATKQYDLDFGRVGFTFLTEMNALMPVYTFGKLKALREAGDQGVIAGGHLRRRAQDEAAFQAAQAYFGYQLARQAKVALAETYAQIDEAGKLVDKLIADDSTQVQKIDSYKVRFFKNQVEARQTQADVGINLAVSAIRLLANYEEKTDLQVAAVDLEAPVMKLETVDRYTELAEDTRPELKAIAAGIKAREQEVLIRERMFLPDFGIAGFFRFQYTSSTTRQRSPFAADPYNDLQGGAALVARGTFDIPVKMAQLDQSRAELDKMLAQQELLRAGIRLEVEKTRGELEDAIRRAAAFEAAEKNARRWATSAYAAFELGTGDTREITDAFAALAQSTGDKLKAWHDAQVSFHQLQRVVGMRLTPDAPTPPAGALPPSR